MSEARPMSGGGWRQARRPASLGWDLVSAPDPTTEGSRAGECVRPCQLGLASAAPRPCLGWAGRHSCRLVAEDPCASYIPLEKEGFHAQFTDKGVEAMNTTSLVKILQCVLFVLRRALPSGPATTHVPATRKYSQTLHSLGTPLFLALCLGFPSTVLALPSFPHLHVSVATLPPPGSLP